MTSNDQDKEKCEVVPSHQEFLEEVCKPTPQGDEFMEGTAEEKALRRKIDLYLMPTLWVLLILNYADRSNVANAKIAGMDTDLKMSDSDYYLVVVIFQVAYVLGAIPSNIILTRTRPSLYIPTIMFLWGTCSTTMAAVKTTNQLIAIRFLLGIFEAGFAPAVLYLISSWYRRKEQTVRTLIYFSGSILAGAFGAVVAGAITKSLEGAHGISGWRWLFLVEGVATVGVALFTPFLLLDFPATCKKLTPAERELAVRRIRADGITATRANIPTMGLVKALFAAVANWRIYLVALPYMQLVGSSALTYFFPALVKGLGYTSVKAQFMTAPIWAVAFAIAIPVAYISDRLPQYRGPIIVVDLLVGCLFCALATGIRAYVARYAFLCFINSAIWAGSSVAVSFASQSLAGAPPEVRAISLAMMTAVAQGAVIYGSALFPSKDAPVYLKGFTTYTALFFFGACIAFAGQYFLKKYPYKSSE